MSEISTPSGDTGTPPRRFRWAAWLVRGVLAVAVLWGVYLLAVNLAPPVPPPWNHGIKTYHRPSGTS